jgi:peptidoglycan hydrolase CwlO-like protein
MLENAMAAQEDYYRKNLADTENKHRQEMQTMLKRQEEQEKAFLSYHKKISEEIAEFSKLKQENDELKAKMGRSAFEPVSLGDCFC